MRQPVAYVILALMAAGVGAAAAAVSERHQQPARPASAVATERAAARSQAAGASLVMFETSSCGWCRRFHKELAGPYRSGPYAARAPLKLATAGSRNDGGYKLTGPIASVPTFVLVDAGGHEIDRRTGYPGGIETFHNQVHAMLQKAGG